MERGECVMEDKKQLIPIVAVTICSLLFFTAVIVIKGNYEFLLYLFVVLALAIAVCIAQRRVHFPPFVLWHLVVWVTLHLAGGNLSFAGTKLYDVILYQFIDEPYHILRFDQVVHVYGFFAATLASYYVLKPLLKKEHHACALFFIVILAGLGLGALNEIVEFPATLLVPRTGVGGYINNALDLVADLLGAIIAMIYLWRREQL